MSKQLDANEILIMLNALDFAKDELKTLYQEKWLNEQLISIKNKLNKQFG
ncbi:hypothetical protein ACFVS2_26230 [Brevibacillus sp. NPDC058079]